jgi:hypothetical protein
MNLALFKLMNNTWIHGYFVCPKVAGYLVDDMPGSAKNRALAPLNLPQCTI